MSEPQSSDQALVVLRTLIEEHSSVHHVARCLGMDHTNLGRVLSGEYRLHHELVEMILDVLGLPVSIFLRLCLPSENLQLSEATALLKSCRPKVGRGRRPSQALDGAWVYEIGEKFPAWLEGAASNEGSRWRDEILRLEEERFASAAEVSSRLEVLAEILLDCLPTRGARADLAMVLAIWSTLRRIEGRRGEARDGYLLAVGCLETTDDSFAEGFVLQKAAYLALDFDRADQSLLLLDGALAAFVIDGQACWQARIFVDRGIVRAHQERWTEAEKELQTALWLLPTEAVLSRLSATEALVDLLVRAGRLAEAEAALGTAENLPCEFPIARAFLTWRRGMLLSAQGRSNEAAEILWIAFELMAKKGEAIDAALVAADLADVLLKLRRTEALRMLVGDTVQWMGKLADNRAAHRALMRLVSYFYAGELSAARISRIRLEIKAADRRRRSTRNWT
jgi:tetratricopeptide (TPR) repeat protein